MIKLNSTATQKPDLPNVSKQRLRTHLIDAIGALWFALLLVIAYALVEFCGGIQ